MENYIKGICYFVIIMTVIFQMFPKDDYLKSVRMIAGFILMMILISPITEQWGNNFDVNSLMSQFELEDNYDLEIKLEEFNDEIQKRIENKN